MNNLPLQLGATMSSVDLRDIINSERVSAGEKKVRNNDFIARIEDEIDDLGVCETFVHPQSGVEMRYYNLNIDQCLLVGMRESKAVRRNVLAELKKREKPALPQTFAEALLLAGRLEQEKEQALLERNIAIETKAEIGNRREATAMNTASQAVKKANALQVELDRSQEWSTIKRMEIITGLKFNWRILKSAGVDLGIDPQEVFDPNFGTVKSYHASVWREAYALDIKQ